MRSEHLDGRVVLHGGDSREVLKGLADCSIDSVVTDPPYFLTSIVKRFGGADAAPAKFGSDGSFKRLSGGFMNKQWDAPDAPAIDPAFAHWMAGFIDGEGCFHVHKKKVNGCETYDCQFSLTLRADDAPIAESMRQALGGIGSIARRPAKGNAREQVRFCVSSKADCMHLRAVLSVFPLRAKKARDFAIWCDALDAWVDHTPGSGWDDIAYYREALMAVRNFGSVHRPERLFFYSIGRELLRVLKPGGHLVMFNGTRTYHHMVCGFEDAGFEIRDTLAWLYGSGFPKSHSMRDIGRPELGTALKPAHEPIVLARKPLQGTVAANVLEHGTGALNIDGCRVGGWKPQVTQGINSTPSSFAVAKERRVSGDSNEGRWPANIVHDGSDEVVAAFPETHSAGSARAEPGGGTYTGDTGIGFAKDGSGIGVGLKGFRIGDASGSAARFFYSAKADKQDRIGSKHPTVKPVDLMQWLCRLVTPPGGTVLDPFAGSGSTGEAAWREGFQCVLIEREPEYQADIAERLRLADKGPMERKARAIKQTAEIGGLFANDNQTVDIAALAASIPPTKSTPEEISARRAARRTKHAA